jgi:hypothetical protein
VAWVGKSGRDVASRGFAHFEFHQTRVLLLLGAWDRYILLSSIALWGLPVDHDSKRLK